MVVASRPGMLVGRGPPRYGCSCLSSGSWLESHGPETSLSVKLEEQPVVTMPSTVGGIQTQKSSRWQQKLGLCDHPVVFLDVAEITSEDELKTLINPGWILVDGARRPTVADLNDDISMSSSMTCQ